MRVRFIAMALFAAVVVALGGTAATTRADAQPASTPDTYVTYWDRSAIRRSPPRR